MNTPERQNPIIRTTAEAYDISPEKVTEVEINHFGGRQQLLSDIATLIENGFEEAAECLIEMHDIDIECTFDLAALRDLANQDIAMDIGVMAKELRE